MLHLTGHYQNFTPAYSNPVEPPTQLTKKPVSFIWSESCQKSFEMLKRFT